MNKNGISVALIVDIVLQSLSVPNPLEFGAIFAQIPLDLNPFFSLISPEGAGPTKTTVLTNETFIEGY